MNEKLCRICLEESKTLISLFHTKEGMAAFEKLLFMIKIDICEVGPSSICIQCHIELENSVKFLEKCEQSNKRLRAHYKAELHNLQQSDCFEQDNRCIEGKNPETEEETSVKEATTHLDEQVLQKSVSKSKPCPECGSKRRCQHHPVTSYTCSLCNKVFNRKYNYSLHVKRHTGQREWPCGVCGAAQVSSSAAREHCRPRRRRVCPVAGCRRTYSSTNNLTIHIRSHTGERPHACRECGKCFVSRTTLNNHLRTHSGVKPFMCAVCGACFATNKLAAHLRTHARNRARPPLVRDPTRSREGAHHCPYCSSRYNHKQSLNRHVRKRHTNSQKNNCSTENMTREIECFEEPGTL